MTNSSFNYPWELFRTKIPKFLFLFVLHIHVRFSLRSKTIVSFVCRNQVVIYTRETSFSNCDICLNEVFLQQTWFDLVQSSHTCLRGREEFEAFHFLREREREVVFDCLK